MYDDLGSEKMACPKTRKRKKTFKNENAETEKII
jgi:hypothetical protein